VGDAAGEAAPPDPERVRRAALAHVRHELKTPVGAIIGYSEMLLEDAQESGEQEETRSDLRRIERAGKELLALIEEILHPDRVAAQGKNLDEFSARVRADLRNPVNAVMGYAEMLIETARESGRERAIPDLQRIHTAAHRLLELSNDIVQVATTARATPEAPTLAPTSAIARGVLAKIRPRRAGPAAEDRQGSLLIVDDNEHNRDLLSRQLARMGYLVASESNGRSALKRVEEQDFDLVLLDIIMPEMDGIEVLRRIRSAPRGQELPVIMISSLDDIDGAIRCLELGAQDYLTKPFHPTLLDARIGACLEAKRMREREAYYRTELEKGDDMIQRLLLSTFPAPIAARVQAGESGIVESALEATVLCCDLSRASGGVRVDAGERVRRIEALLALIEAEAERQGLETTVLEGSRLLMGAGVALPVEDHAQRAARAAVNALTSLRGRSDSDFAAIRFGLHTGAVAGGVIEGEHMAFSIWGDTVDLARRLEAQADPGTVHVSSAAYALLKDRFPMRSGGVVDVPGWGQMRTFTLSAGNAAQA
jgi:CheY-like chemotaxis protein